MKEQYFNNYNLTDEEILSIIEQSLPIINRNSKINGVIDEDLKQDIIVNIYEQLKSKRKDK